MNEAIGRIIAAIRLRVGVPPVREAEFIGIIGNHGQFRKKLATLDQVRAAEDIERSAYYVGVCWLRLALEHLEDARHSCSVGRTRATFSRSYYAAYNASKAVRYVVGGAVSLKGDDHGKASSGLPDDFPNVDKWSEIVTLLFEHRLRADYDNWISTTREHSLNPSQALKLAEEFVDRCRLYLGEKMGAPI